MGWRKRKLSDTEPLNVRYLRKKVFHVVDCHQSPYSYEKPSDEGTTISFYVGNYSYKDLHPLYFQRLWLDDQSGYVFSTEVWHSLRKLKEIATENNVSFIDLGLYAIYYDMSEEEKKSRNFNYQYIEKDENYATLAVDISKEEVANEVLQIANDILGDGDISIFSAKAFFIGWLSMYLTDEEDNKSLAVMYANARKLLSEEFEYITYEAAGKLDCYYTLYHFSIRNFIIKLMNAPYYECEDNAKIIKNALEKFARKKTIKSYKFFDMKKMVAELRKEIKNH